MIRLFANAGYDFIRWRRWAYGLTAALIIPGFALFLVHGLNYSIEFTGGTLVQVRTTQAVGTERIRGALDAAGIRDAEIQQFGGANEYKVQARLGTTAATTEVSTQATAQAVDSALAHGLGPDQYKIVRYEAVGPKVGRELQGKAFLAIFFSFIVTLIYLAIRFEWRFGLAAVLATLHDILTTIAFVRYLNLEVSLVVVCAVLQGHGEALPGPGRGGPPGVRAGGDGGPRATRPAASAHPVRARKWRALVWSTPTATWATWRSTWIATRCWSGPAWPACATSS